MNLGDKNTGTAALRAGAVANEWARAAEAIVHTDMSRDQPEAVLSPILRRGCWKVIPYETVERVAGKIVWASPEADVPDLAIPLEVEGWYAIFVALFVAPECPSVAWLRLDGDPAGLRREARIDVAYGSAEEVFFKVARLEKSTRLHLCPQRRGYTQPCGLAHIRLVPLSPDEIE